MNLKPYKVKLLNYRDLYTIRGGMFGNGAFMNEGALTIKAGAGVRLGGIVSCLASDGHKELLLGPLDEIMKNLSILSHPSITSDRYEILKKGENYSIIQWKNTNSEPSRSFYAAAATCFFTTIDEATIGKVINNANPVINYVMPHWTPKPMDAEVIKESVDKMIFKSTNILFLITCKQWRCKQPKNVCISPLRH